MSVIYNKSSETTDYDKEGKEENEFILSILQHFTKSFKTTIIIVVLYAT